MCTAVKTATCATIVVALLSCPARPAAASPQTISSSFDTQPQELLVGVTLASPPDVNVHPRCDDLGLPCTSPKTFGDPGASLQFARYLGSRFALFAEGGFYENIWDSVKTVDTRHREHNTVVSAVAGPRVSTGYFSTGGPRASTIRLFAQVGVGAEQNAVVAGGRIIRPGGGIDIKTRLGLLVRIEMDDTFAPTRSRDVGGGRVLIAVGAGFGGT